jgi:UDP-N-acetylmuramoylalanine--D-glutamate ligase
MLVDRAFAPELALGPVAGIPVPGPIGVLNALGASALARAVDVASGAIADALSSFEPAPHRAHVVDVVGGVAYVDDSKATNPHAAGASLAAFEGIVWVAGGLAKGATFDDLVAAHGKRLRAAVLIGRDRQLIADALSRHAPDVPVVEVPMTETGDVAGEDRAVQVMDQVVARAAELARPGDTVLLAPAAASMDMFRDYNARGDAFAAAVRKFTAGPAGGSGGPNGAL